MSVSTISSSTNRITGLASGLDTDELVEDLTATTRNKIAKAEQQKQILEWKQEDYRDILTDLFDFSDKYFGSSSSSTLIGSSLNNLASTSSNSSYVTAIAGDNATSGSVYISDIVSLATAAKVQSSSVVSPELSFTVDTGNLSELGGQSMEVTLDGVTKTITFSEGTYTSSEDVATALGTLLDSAFGEGRINVSGTDGNLTFTTENSTLSIAEVETEGENALATLGFDDTDISSNRLDLSKTLAEYSSLFGSDETFSFTINGEEFSLASSTTLSKVISVINASDANVKIAYSSVTDTFTITSKETGAGSSLEFSDSTGSFLSTIMGGSGTATAGQDAVVKLSLNGSTDAADQITVTRSSNSFTLEGVTYTLKGMSAGSTEEGITVTTERDVDDLVDKITSFVNDYNELLEAINGKLYEERDSDFLPLTDDEKEELSDDEIETWTEQAREGWLRNDTYLSAIASSLRSALYTDVQKTDGSGESLALILADIGITTGDYTENGKLTIDEDQLREALTTDADSVLNLLTQSSTVSYSLYNTAENKTTRYNESGLLWRINDIIKANINTVGGKKGALINLVGNPNTGYTGTYTYSERINDVDDTIDELKDKLEDEEEYYYNKFTAMETSINTLNAQISYLTSQMSS